MGNRILIIAPHPDDEVLGCGGVMARFSGENSEIHVVIVTKGCSPLYSETQVACSRRETKKAHNLLGVKKSYWLDFPAAELDMVMHRELNQSLCELLKEVRPEVLFIPFLGDTHLDHQLVFSSSLVASRPASQFCPKSIYAYETLSETNWNAPHVTPAFVPNVFFDIEEYLEKKLAAFKCYASQCKVFPNERSIESLEYLAKLRGSQVNRKAAEAFMLIRNII